jgi:hypothetical protein
MLIGGAGRVSARLRVAVRSRSAAESFQLLRKCAVYTFNESLFKIPVRHHTLLTSPLVRSDGRLEYVVPVYFVDVKRKGRPY